MSDSFVTPWSLPGSSVHGISPWDFPSKNTGVDCHFLLQRIIFIYITCKCSLDHHQLDGHEFEQAPGVGDGQGSLAGCSPWGCKELDTTEWLNWIEMFITNFQGNSILLIDVNTEAWQGGVAYPRWHCCKGSGSFWHWLFLTVMWSFFTKCNRGPGRLLLSFIFILFSSYFPSCLTITIWYLLKCVSGCGDPLSKYGERLGVSKDPWATMRCPAPVTEGGPDG